MLQTTQNKGFQLFFENGYGVSVQFGYGNYCDNRDYTRSDYDREFDMNGIVACNNAEIAVLRGSPKQWDFCSREVAPDIFCSDEVAGWKSADDVARLIARVQSL